MAETIGPVINKSASDLALKAGRIIQRLIMANAFDRAKEDGEKVVTTQHVLNVIEELVGRDLIDEIQCQLLDATNERRESQRAAV